jgi:uncharacterized protein (DUF1015 family)
MAEIVPFRAYRYNAERVELFKAVTQPYDKISPDMQDKYYAASPFNLIAVEKGKARADDSPADNVYTRAARSLEDWIASGVLLRDATPAVYAYFQEYIVPGSGERRTRKGFIALGRIEDYSAGVIFRHEQTLAGPKADRLELLRHTRTHTGQLFMLYTDLARRVDALLDRAAQAGKPAGEVRDEYGVVHKLWPITDADTLATIAREMAPQRLVIADGHHRYETALAYRNECRARAASEDRNAPHEFVMMTLFNTDVEGLTILPTHRVIAGLAEFTFEKVCAELQPIFEWRAYRFNAKERDRTWRKFRGDLEENGRNRPAIGVFAGDGAFHLFLLRGGADLDALLPGVSPAQRRLDVVLLHRLILERGLGITADAVTRERNLTYEREAEAAIAAVESGRAQLCCLLNSIPVGRVAEIALAGEVLPQKSTDFYPKLLSGLTLYRLE